MTPCKCGGTFRPSDGYWTCQTCGETGAHVRPVRKIAVELSEWQGKGHWDFDAKRYRESTLKKARGWARRLGGTVIIGVRRRPELTIATIQGF